MPSKSKESIFCGVEVLPGEKKDLELSVGKTYDSVDIKIPILVKRGRAPGPTLFLSAAIHGDEINGTEIIRQALQLKELRSLRGTLVCVPIVNVYGFNSRSRYFPDGRDLNRCFPGSVKGSLASRVAHLFNKEVVKKCDYGIDLHTGARQRENLPQIRANLSNPKTRTLAKAFGAPITLDSALRDGSLRETARKQGLTMLLYEGGQALRFDEKAIKCGVQGIKSIMRSIGMLKKSSLETKVNKTVVAKSSHWVRSQRGGLLVTGRKLGDRVRKNSELGILTDPFGKQQSVMTSPYDGVVIGKSNLPLVNQGDAIFHIACFKTVAKNFKSSLIDSDNLD